MNDSNIIILLRIKSKNDHYKIFQAVNIAFAKLNSIIQSTKGQPCNYSDERIIAR